MRRALSFDDVLIVPAQNEIKSRDDVDTVSRVGLINLQVPIIAANMPSVCESRMAIALGRLGALGVIHRMQAIDAQASMVEEARFSLGSEGSVGAAVGIGSDALERADQCVLSGANVICLDVAHGHQSRVLKTAQKVLHSNEDITLIIGNLSTANSVQYFCDELYADLPRVVFKVGVGGGSLCITRVRTGCGLPTFQSLYDVLGHDYTVTEDATVSRPEVNVIADGGIKSSGDIVKSLAVGASSVMLGSLLSGTNESPGDVYRDGHQFVKIYRGSASFGEKKKFYGKSEYIEGAEAFVPYKGSVTAIVEQLMAGLRSGMTYCGASTLAELRHRAEFVQITSSGHQESNPHLLVNKGPY